MEKKKISVEQLTKKCTICGNEYPFTTEFFTKSSKNRGSKIQPSCKKCRVHVAKKYAESNKDKVIEYQKKYRENNKEKLREYSLAYYVENKNKWPKYSELNTEQLNNMIVRHKKWYEKNKDYVLDKRHSAYKNNKDNILARQKKWRDAHPNVGAVARQRRRSLLRNTLSTLTATQWKFAKEYFNNMCAYCGKQLPLSQDHVVPLTKGGEHTKDNIIPACYSCNSSKNNKDLSVWYRQRVFYSQDRHKAICDYVDNVGKIMCKAFGEDAKN